MGDGLEHRAMEAKSSPGPRRVSIPHGTVADGSGGGTTCALHVRFNRTKNQDVLKKLSKEPGTHLWERVNSVFDDFLKSQGARLAGELLTSLPAILVDDDDGVAEARRRSRELENEPGSGCSWEDIKRNHGR